MKRLSLAALLAPAVLLVACGGSPEPAPTAAPAPVEAPKPTEVAQAPTTPPAAEPVDVCALLSKEDAEAVIGKLMKEPEAKEAKGSLLGECDYISGDGTLMMVSARPAAEFDATVKYAEKKSPNKEVPGLGEKAFETSAGVMVQPAGKPYFIVVFGAGAGGAEGAKALELAKKLKL